MRHVHLPKSFLLSLLNDPVWAQRTMVERRLGGLTVGRVTSPSRSTYASMPRIIHYRAQDLARTEVKDLRLIAATEADACLRSTFRLAIETGPHLVRLYLHRRYPRLRLA